MVHLRQTRRASGRRARGPASRSTERLRALPGRALSRASSRHKLYELDGRRRVHMETEEKPSGTPPASRPSDGNPFREEMPEPSTAPPASGSAASASTPRLEALDAPRWIASVMIIIYHMYNGSEYSGAWHVFATWGSNWTSFFFVLSGFVLAYVELARSPAKRGPQLSQLQYVRKRLITIYPTYIFVLVLTLAQGNAHSDFAWSLLPLNILLMQAWLPIMAEVRPGHYQCAGQGEWARAPWRWLLLSGVAINIVCFACRLRCPGS